LAAAAREWQSAIGSAFVGWAMAQAQAGSDFGIAGAIASATAGKAGAAAGSIYSAAVSKAAGDLTRALNAVQTGFVDAATAASVKATKAIAAAETVERKAVAKADVVLAQDLQSAWGTYAAVERSAVTLNARERATIRADYKKEVAGAELAAVKAVAPARKTSMVATAEANGVYHVKVTGIVADLGILGGEIKVEQVKAKATSISAWLGQKAQGLWDTAKDVVGTISKSYDTISLAAHTTLSGLGVIPGFGVVPDLADFALTAIEIPFGKSDGKDLGLATLGVFATVAPGPVDGLAAGAKITTRLAKAGARVADGAGAAGKGFSGLAGAGKTFLSTEPNRIYSARELIRRSTDPGPFHNFPESLNLAIFNHGSKTHVPGFYRHSKNGLAHDAIQYRLPGTVNGKDGVFEIFTRPSLTGRTEIIIHRFFNPTKP
jgi:hypothetical protein